MVRKSRGLRYGTRTKLKRRPGERTPITKFLRQFDVGSRVVFMPNSSSQRGMPFPRFKGKVGVVVEKRGRGYVVEFNDGKSTKKQMVMPEHIKNMG